MHQFFVIWAHGLGTQTGKLTSGRPWNATEVLMKSLIIVKILKSHFQEGFIYVKAYFLFEKFRVYIHSFLVCPAKYMITETQHATTFLAQS